MKKNEERIIFNITIMSGKDSAADLSAKNTYQQLNLSLNVDSGLPNLDKIRKQCLSMENANGKCIYTRLSAYIENRCHSAKKANTLLNTKYPLLNLLFNIIEPYRRKNIRISLYPGDRNCISGLNMRETTHNMIIQFDKNVNTFVATEPHNNPPSFYQVCSNEETALLYIEALLVDSCMCHYLAISEAAYFHDKQQEISKEKVEFIRYIYESDKIDFLSSGAKRLLLYVAKKITDKTPYISFLSIFTVPSIEFQIEDPISSYFKDYCKLWVEFQKWYFKKHGKMFNKDNVENSLKSLLVRNKYEGQVSPEKCDNKLKEVIKKHNYNTEKHIFGWEQLYALVILKHNPDDPKNVAQFEAMFPGDIHPCTWKMLKWEQIIERTQLHSELEIIPFLIEKI